MQASEQTSGRLSQNALPGLKSVASAIAAPASASARAGGIGLPRKSALAGRRTPTTSLAASAEMPAAPVLSRWSTERAPSSIASGMAPDSVNWSPCSRSSRPASAQAWRYRPASSTSKAPRSRKTSAASAMRRRFGKDLRDEEVDIRRRAGVGELGRDRMGAEPGGDSPGRANRAELGKLRLAIEPVSRLCLERRRPGADASRQRGARALRRDRSRRPPASLGPWRGCHRPPHAAPRSRLLTHAARTPQLDHPRNRHAYGSRRGPGSPRVLARRAPRLRRRAASDRFIAPTAAMRPCSQSR